MAIDGTFEAYIGLSLLHEVKAIGGIPALVQEFGLRLPPDESVLDWLALDILSMPQGASRSGIWKGDVLFQVTAFSRDGAERPDKISDAAWRNVGIVARGLENRHISIKKYGGDSSYVADMAVKRPTPQSLPPPKGSNVWGVAMTFHGHIQTG